MRKSIYFEEFIQKPTHLWDNQWLLLTSGDFSSGTYNTMTVGWGSIGYLWRRPFVQVFVRPVRYTYEFMQHYETFTLCAFPSKYRAALNLLGNKSGRDGNKIADSGLQPIASSEIASPGYAEAELIIECRKIYWDDINPAHFLDGGIDANYPNKDYHRIYFGEVLAIFGVEKFSEK